MSFLSALAGWSVALTVHAQSAVPIFSFDASGTNGAYPEANLTLGPDGNFYGTTESGGVTTNGTIFKVTTNGTFATLVNFNGTNGANPLAALTLGPDGNFYGTTEYGGNTIGNSSLNAGLGGGTVFQMTTNGTLTTLVNFAGTNGSSPHGGLIWGPDGNLYGTTANGGPNGLPYGTVFRATTNGSLITFTNFNNSNGAYPYAGLTLGPDGNFYGATYHGGSANLGTLFRVTTNGTLTTLVNFNNTNGAYPLGGLTFGPDNKLYGTGSSGGAGTNGTVFVFGLPPYPITLTGSGGGGYTVFVGSYPDSTNRIWATTNLASPSSWEVLGTITTDADGMGQLLDTNTAGIPAKFYRLSYP
jgi:uncharacterized repeat protein (TIGR03803 family)